MRGPDWIYWLVRWFPAQSFYFGRRNFEAGVAERVINKRERIGDIVVAQWEGRHAVIEFPAIHDHFSLPAIDHRLNRSILVCVQII